MKDLMTISIGTMVRVAQCSWAKIAPTHYPHYPLFASLLKQWSKCSFEHLRQILTNKYLLSKKLKGKDRRTKAEKLLFVCSPLCSLNAKVALVPSRCSFLSLLYISHFLSWRASL